MLSKLGFNNIDQFINQVIPEDIQLKEKCSEILPQGCSEMEALSELEEIANKNTKMRSLIGIGSLYAVSQFNKPVKRIDLYQEMQGGASGGTIETAFTMGKLSKEMRDPFLLNPENSVTEEQRKNSKDEMKIEKIEELDAWCLVTI